ncbi:MAG: hypothetical protein ACK40Y_10620 [Cloacibacterium caeni]
MKNIFSISMKILFVSFIISSCNGGANEIKEGDKVQDTSHPKLNQYPTSESEKSIMNDNSNLSKDTITELLSELKKIPIEGDYKTMGELKTDILKFKSVGFGDLLHIGFVDKKNKEYDFNQNISKIELIKDATNPTEENGGYEPVKKYLNKNFRVVWRTLQLRHKPKDEMEMYYEMYEQIIYLKQID